MPRRFLRCSGGLGARGGRLLHDANACLLPGDDTVMQGAKNPASGCETRSKLSTLRYEDTARRGGSWSRLGFRVGVPTLAFPGASSHLNGTENAGEELCLPGVLNGVSYCSTRNFAAADASRSSSFSLVLYLLLECPKLASLECCAFP